MRISDWSSDVCSSDLGTLNHRHVAEVAQVDPAVALLRAVVVPDPGIAGRARIVFAPPFAPTLQHQHLAPRLSEAAGGRRPTEAGADEDRKTVGSGQSVSVRVDIGGARSNKKKTKNNHTNTYTHT